MNKRRVEMVFEGFVDRNREERIAATCPQAFQPDGFVADGNAEGFMVTDIQIDRQSVAGGLFPAESLRVILPVFHSRPVRQGSTMTITVKNNSSARTFSAVLSGPTVE